MDDDPICCVAHCPPRHAWPRVGRWLTPRRFPLVDHPQHHVPVGLNPVARGYEACTHRELIGAFDPARWRTSETRGLQCTLRTCMHSSSSGGTRPRDEAQPMPIPLEADGMKYVV